MSEEIDFGQFIELLDKALVSKDPNIQKALKKFLFIASLASDDAPADGPFSKLVKNIEDLQRRLAFLEAINAAQSNPGYFPNSAPYQSPGWGPNSPGTGWPWSSTGGTSVVSIPTIWQNTSPVYQGPVGGTTNVGAGGTTTVSVTLPDSSSDNFLGGPSPGTGINFTSFTNSLSSETRDNLIAGALADLDKLAEDK